MNATPSHRQPPPGVQADVASGGATSLVPRWRFPREAYPDLANKTGGGSPAPAGSILIVVAAGFGIAAMAFLSGPDPFGLLIDHERIDMGIVWSGASLAFGGAAVLVGALSETLPPRGVAVLKARVRFQRIQRRQLRAKHQKWMRREFLDLVAALSGPPMVEGV